MDLLLAAGFFATGIGTFAFAVAPVLSGDESGLGSVETWAAVGASLFGAALIATAPFVSRRTGRRKRALSVTVVLVLVSLGGHLVRRPLPRARHGRLGAGRNSLAVDRRRVRTARSALADRRHRLRAPLSPSRPRSRQLAHARTHARRLRRSPLRARAAPLERLRAPERRVAPGRIRCAARRRVAGDRPGRVRPCRGRGAGARRPRHPRRARAVPLCDLGPDQHARVRRCASTRSCPASSSPRPRRSRRRSSRCSHSPRHPGRRRSTPRSGATSTSSSPTANSTSRWRSTRT